MTTIRFLMLWLFLLLIGNLSLQDRPGQAAPPASQYQINLPLIMGSTYPVHGFVTTYGAPAVSVPVSLIACSPGRTIPICVPIGTANTTDTGFYVFSIFPNLTGTPSDNLYTYKVAYTDDSFNSIDRLSYWETHPFTYMPGDSVTVEPFDIGFNVLTPPNGSSLPQQTVSTTITLTFRWLSHTAPPSETYQLRVGEYNPSSALEPNNLFFATPKLSTTSQAIIAFEYDHASCLVCTPVILGPDKTYGWQIEINGSGSDTGWGRSKVYRFTLPLTTP